MAAKRLLAVWAHPDDEAFGPVGTMRMAHEHGWQTALITATRGDAGVAELVDLEPDQSLGDVREGELRAACGVLGVERVDVWRYGDGKLNELPKGELAGRISHVIRDWRPHVVLTFGPDGITGHPDHVAISAATVEAFHAVREAQSNGVPQFLYFNTVQPGREIESQMGEAPPPKPPTTVVDVSRYEAVKREALACHASQQGDWGPMLDDRDWLTVDRFFRAFPPLDAATPSETTILHE